MLADNHNHDHDSEFLPPPNLDETIRVILCTSNSPDDLTRRVHTAIGEHSSTSDELHVSHATAPDPHTGHMLYSTLIVLRPRSSD